MVSVQQVGIFRNCIRMLEIRNFGVMVYILLPGQKPHTLGTLPPTPVFAQPLSCLSPYPVTGKKTLDSGSSWWDLVLFPGYPRPAASLPSLQGGAAQVLRSHSCSILLPSLLRPASLGSSEGLARVQLLQPFLSFPCSLVWASLHERDPDAPPSAQSHCLWTLMYDQPKVQLHLLRIKGSWC